MSIGLKGFYSLQGRISKLQAQLDICCPGEDPGTDSLCKYETCEPGCTPPEGFPSTIDSIHLDPAFYGWAECQVNIKVSYEWFPEGAPEPETWCCCYTYVGPSEETEATAYVVAVELTEGCEDPDACVDCNVAGDIFGCTDPTAINYNPLATIDDGSCEY